MRSKTRSNPIPHCAKKSATATIRGHRSSSLSLLLLLLCDNFDKVVDGVPTSPVGEETPIPLPKSEVEKEEEEEEEFRVKLECCCCCCVGDEEECRGGREKEIG